MASDLRIVPGMKTQKAKTKRSTTSAIQPFKKVIWSVDAFEKRSETLPHVVETIRALWKGSEQTGSKKGPAIEPVYVLSPDQLDLSVTFSAPWVKTYKPAAAKAVNHMIQEEALLKDARESGSVKEPQILVQHGPSLSATTKMLSKFAKGQKADLLVIGSHGRKGMDRLILGSFAESLVYQSQTPLLVVRTTHMKETHGFKKILFPTDFGKKSLKAFEKLLSLAKHTGGHVTLLHVVREPLEPVLQSGVYLLGGGWVPVPQFLKDQEAFAHKNAQKWMDLAKKYGVEADLKVHTGGTSVLESILSLQTKGSFDLIAMEAQSSKFEAVVLGSITREVVRKANSPVWICRV